ncbi:hypothetical protein K6L44_03020, partial [Gluconacetobacter entanii]|uniref:hypothetical protein n=1 Tax=Gluconacetobacter entanii TaxID=108528 RepID=UPI001C936C4D
VVPARPPAHVATRAMNRVTRDMMNVCRTAFSRTLPVPARRPSPGAPMSRIAWRTHVPMPRIRGVYDPIGTTIGAPVP